VEHKFTEYLFTLINH